MTIAGKDGTATLTFASGSSLNQMVSTINNSSGLTGVSAAASPFRRHGLTAEIVAATRSALERHGLVKAKMTPQCELDKEVVARDLAWATGAKLIQRIGKTAILFRPDIKLDPPVTHRRGGRG